MKYLFLLSFIFLSACGQQNNNDPRTISGVDSSLLSYKNLYISAKGRGLDYDIPIQFSNLVYPTVGVCTKWSSGYRQIEIDPTYWNNISEDIKLQLIFHELGHCDLNRGHTSEIASNGYPVSFMYPYTFHYYQSQLAGYIVELFSPSSNTTTTTSSDCVHDI